MEGKLVVICGPMFAGKTTELIRVGQRYTLADRKVVYIKPKLDDRYSDNEIVTHDGVRVKAIALDSYYKDLTDFKEVMEADVVLIDEIQFYTREIQSSIHCLIKKGKIVYVAGLDLTYNEEGFILVGDLMLLADKVVKTKAVCKLCGKEATRSYRKDTNCDDLVELGADEKYMALCKGCYYGLRM